MRLLHRPELLATATSARRRAFGKDKFTSVIPGKTENFQVRASNPSGCLYGYRRDWKEHRAFTGYQAFRALFSVMAESDTGAGNQIKEVVFAASGY